MSDSRIAAPPARLRDLGAGRTDLIKMDPSIIKIEAGHNPRDYRLPENRAHLDSLKLSIAEMGVHTPLHVRFDGGQAVLVNGECRLTAVLELIAEGREIKTVPVMQVTANNEADRIMLALATNTGKPLSEWELGSAFKRLEGYGWTLEQMAAKMGMTSTKVAKCIELSDMPQDIKQMLSERAITPALAISTLRKKGSVKAAKELKERVAENEASGKKGPARAAKSASKKEVAAQEWEKVGRALYKSALDTWSEMQKPGAEQFDWIEVRYGVFKKLAALIEGTK